MFCLLSPSRNVFQYTTAEKTCSKLPQKEAHSPLCSWESGMKRCCYSGSISKTSAISPLTKILGQKRGKTIRPENTKHGLFIVRYSESYPWAWRPPSVKTQSLFLYDWGRLLLVPVNNPRGRCAHRNERLGQTEAGTASKLQSGIRQIFKSEPWPLCQSLIFFICRFPIQRSSWKTLTISSLTTAQNHWLWPPQKRPEECLVLVL